MAINYNLPDRSSLTTIETLRELFVVMKSADVDKPENAQTLDKVHSIHSNTLRNALCTLLDTSKFDESTYVDTAYARAARCGKYNDYAYDNKQTIHSALSVAEEFIFCPCVATLIEVIKLCNAINDNRDAKNAIRHIAYYAMSAYAYDADTELIPASEEEQLEIMDAIKPCGGYVNSGFMHTMSSLGLTSKMVKFTADTSKHKDRFIRLFGKALSPAMFKGIVQETERETKPCNIPEVYLLWAIEGAVNNILADRTPRDYGRNRVFHENAIQTWLKRAFRQNPDYIAKANNFISLLNIMK
jgi:hypothetical protein